jgi:hypothetical protein
MLQQWFDSKATCFSGLIKEATAQAFSAQWSNRPLAPPPSVRIERAGASQMSAAIPAQKTRLYAPE